MFAPPALKYACRLLLATLMFAVLLPLGSAYSQEAASPSIELVEQSDWVAGGSPFNIDVRVNGNVDVAQTELIVTVYGALPNRTQFQQTLEDKGFGSSQILERRSLDESLGPDGIVRLSLPVQDPAQRRYFLRNGGVYPVKVELRSAGSAQSIDLFTTHLINVPTGNQAPTKLQVASVIPVRSPFADISTDPLTVPDSGNSLKTVAASLNQYPSTPLTLAPAPETLERAASEPEADEAIKAIALVRNSREVLGSPYVPLSSPMFTPELSGERTRQFERGDQELTKAFGAANTETALVTSQIDTPALQTYKERGMQRLLISESALAPQQRDTTLARPFSLSTGRNSATVPAVQLDSGLASHFSKSDNKILAAHQLIADLAVIYNDRPGLERGVALTAPDRWVPDTEFLSVYLRALTTSPILAATGTNDLFELAPEGGGRTGTVRQLNARPKNAVDDFQIEKISALRKQIDGYASMVDPTNASLNQIERRTLLAESATLSNEERNRSLDSSTDSLQTRLDSIRLPSERSIRFTARKGEVPVSIQNDTGSTVNVVVRMSSDRVDFLDGSSRTLEVERQQVTERFNVDARTSGVFPVQVRLESPDGTLVLARSRILISSTATSQVGVILSVGAGAFLAVWWVRSIIRSRRAK